MVVLMMLAAWAAPDEEPKDVTVEPPTETTVLPAVVGAREGLSASGLYVEFGRGVALTKRGDPFELVLRGRLQVRGTVAGNPDADPDLSVEIRRARIALLGQARDVPLDLYIQVGLGSNDLESDLRVPLRDGVLTWRPSRDVSFRIGQMKTPFSRQRMVSSSALQFVDRSAVNAEFNLDRDMGVQFFSNDLFGLDGLIAVQAGVYGGDGRNRANKGTGLLYVGRIQIQPFGGFKDVFAEADLTRESRLRLSIGAAGGRNQDTFRARSTHGIVLEGAYDTNHGAVDLLAKWRGWALQSELLSRVVVDADAPVDEVGPTSGWGVMAQLGHVLPSRWELAARYAHIGPLNGATIEQAPREEVQVAIGHYLARHDFKAQADAGLAWTEDEPPSPTVRAQVQVFF